MTPWMNGNSSFWIGLRVNGHSSVESGMVILTLILECSASWTNNCFVIETGIRRGAAAAAAATTTVSMCVCVCGCGWLIPLKYQLYRNEPFHEPVQH